MARDHLELIRHALVLMILRILKVDEKNINYIIGKTIYKGRHRPFMCLLARIRFDPVEVQNVCGQPKVKAWLEKGAYTKKVDELEYQPEMRFEVGNVKEMTQYGTQFARDPGAPMRSG
jgi:hypothetical protein